MAALVSQATRIASTTRSLVCHWQLTQLPPQWPPARTPLLGGGRDLLRGLGVEAHDEGPAGGGQVDVAGGDVVGCRQQEAQQHAVLRQRAQRRLHRLHRPGRVRLHIGQDCRA